MTKESLKTFIIGVVENLQKLHPPTISMIHSYTSCNSKYSVLQFSNSFSKQCYHDGKTVVFIATYEYYHAYNTQPMHVDLLNI